MTIFYSFLALGFYFIFYLIKGVLEILLINKRVLQFTTKIDSLCGTDWTSIKITLISWLPWEAVTGTILDAFTKGLEDKAINGY